MVHLGPWAGDDIYIYIYIYVVYEMYTYKDYIYISMMVNVVTRLYVCIDLNLL